MHKPAIAAGALFAGLAVALGAFGAHALKAMLPTEQLAIYQTGVQYQYYHSFALLITGILFSAYPVRALKMATTFFITGILLFSGSLYAMCFLGMHNVGLGPVGIITPIGGLFFIAGWVSILFGILKRN